MPSQAACTFSLSPCDSSACPLGTSNGWVKPRGHGQQEIMLRLGFWWSSARAVVFSGEESRASRRKNHFCWLNREFPVRGKLSMRRRRALVLGMVAMAMGQGRELTEEAGGRVLEWSWRPDL